MATTFHQTDQTPATLLVRYDMRRDILAGIVSGQVAGLIMAVAMIGVFTFFLGTAWYHPVQVIGAFAFGDAALPGTFHLPGFLAGLVIHQAVATLLWSLPFGLLMNKLEHSTLNVLAVGLMIGVLSQVIDVTFIVPALMNGLHGHNIWAENVPNSWSWIAHLVFGIGFTTFLPIWRRTLPANMPGVY
jgi:hypothetical protein